MTMFQSQAEKDGLQGVELDDFGSPFQPYNSMIVSKMRKEI